MVKIMGATRLSTFCTACARLGMACTACMELSAITRARCRTHLARAQACINKVCIVDWTLGESLGQEAAHYIGKRNPCGRTNVILPQVEKAAKRKWKGTTTEPQHGVQQRIF